MWKKIIYIFVIALIFLTSIMMYSHYIEPKHVIVKEKKVTHSLIPDSFHGFKIVHISDIHYGTVLNEKQGQKIVQKINQIHPDIVVLTGDLLDKNIPLNEKEQKALTNILKNIKADIGKYAIKGEHDTSHKEWESIITGSGFTNLNDTYELIYHEDYTPILIAGMSTNLGIKKNAKEKLQTTMDFINEYQTNTGQNLYSILLVHEPDYMDSIEINAFKLVLAGHSHGGQINLPFIRSYLSPKGAKKYHDDNYKINDTDIYISTGIGTTTFTYRFLNPSSFNFYRITNK